MTPGISVVGTLVLARLNNNNNNNLKDISRWEELISKRFTRTSKVVCTGRFGPVCAGLPRLNEALRLPYSSTYATE